MDAPIASKHLAETTYVKVDEADATYVLVDGKVYDLGTMPNNATDTIFLKEEIGCIFTIEDQSEVSSVLALLDPATIKINYIQKQSVAALRAFAEHDVKVGGLNDAVNNFTVSDMINIAPDTMFDDAELRNAKINVENLFCINNFSQVFRIIWHNAIGHTSIRNIT